MKKVLIVDDEEDVCQMLAKTVRRKGFEVLICGDGLTAVEMFKTHKPDVTFLDLHIPKLTGWQVLEEIRKIDASAKVYIVTGDHNEAEELKAKNVSVSGYVLKPIDFGEFVKIVEENK